VSRPWAVFLDRDGTLVPDAVHPTRPGDLRLYRATGPALRGLRAAGARLLVVSNQSAVARGLLTPAGLRRLDRRLRDLLRREAVTLTAVYYCPHHPEFTGPCPCRKPEPGMIDRGLRRLGLPGRACYLVGDSAHDLEAGRRRGLTTVLVLTGHGHAEHARVRREGLADAVARDVGGAARWILDRERGS
jgi:histidinol-phosphate phosphatase family protein